MNTRVRFLMLILVCGVALTFVFWWPLYAGAGFIGGDLYPYFFPQKAFYADRLKLNEFPLWNDLTGFGYPVLGESQTGAAYPLHLVFYRCLDLNTAYNAEHLLHYILCFVATALFAKRIGLTSAGAALTALIFTYGWFPPRACLEWAIVTGAWLPVALWCVESFLQTRWWRYAIGLSITLGMQLLAGHFHLAFITQLLVVTYALTRLWIEQRERRTGPCLTERPCGKRAAVGLGLAGVAGICLGSVQLLPTWELKQRSSRIVTGGEYDPAYGHMPPLYASQLIVPWCWYSPQAITEDNIVRTIAEFSAPWHWFGPDHDVDQAVQQSRFLALSNGTNKVEAHVYCGMIPILMALAATVVWLRESWKSRLPNQTTSLMNSTTGYWLIAGFFALVYATGWLLPIGRHVPGFSFFRGPGRYGIVTTLSVALLAGQLLSRFGSRIVSSTTRFTVMSLIFVSTCGDLWLVSRMVKYTEIIRRPAISYREESEVRRTLLAVEGLPRLLAPGPNVGNLLSVSCVPWYLGIAPEEYVDPLLAMPPIPKPLPNGKPTPCSTELLEWLSFSGVTHVLNFEPLDEASWRAELVWKGVDPLLNRVWGRSEPIYLYRFRTGSGDDESESFPGRAYIRNDSAQIQRRGIDETNSERSDPDKTNPESRRVIVEAGGSGKLILTELAYPGWTVKRNGQSWDAGRSGIFRAVECPADGGEFVWIYHPRSVYAGACLSALTILVLAALGHIRFWHPSLTQWPQKKSSGNKTQ